MQRTAEVVIVGAGVIGTSIAFHLSRLGLRDVLLVDSGAIAGQASAQSGALVRMHYTNLDESRLALAALPWFEEWGERVGGSCGFVPTGFMQLVAPDDRERLVRNTERLQAIGVTTEIVGADELRRLQPMAHFDDDDIAAYEPRSGYADGRATAQGFAQAAQRNGATICEHTPVMALRTEGGRIRGVDTVDGSVDAPTVVLACGNWAVALAQPLGVATPLHPTWIEVSLFERPAPLARGPDGHMTMIDRRNGFYLRPNGDDQTLVGLSAFHHTLHDIDRGKERSDPAFVVAARHQAAQRFPALAQSRLVGGRSGPLDVTTDGRPIIGTTPGIDGLYLAVGMSGTGFKKSPAIGACIAELIIGGAATTAPIEPFALERFQSGRLLTGDEYTLPPEAMSKEETKVLLGRGVVH